MRLVPQFATAAALFAAAAVPPSLALAGEGNWDSIRARLWASMGG